MRKLVRQFAPTIVLQHPHSTDTPNIWRHAWAELIRELPRGGRERPEGIVARPAQSADGVIGPVGDIDGGEITCAPQAGPAPRLALGVINEIMLSA